MRHIIFILSLLIFRVFSQQKSVDIKQSYSLADVFQYSEYLKQDSDLSVVMVACDSRHKMQLTIKSFLFYNTYPIKKIYIAHCSKKLIPDTILPYGYPSYKQFFEVIQLLDQKTGIIQALIKIYQKIDTKYVYQTDTQWLMVKGFGFIEQSIKILKYGANKNIKMAQVTPNYPYWRALAQLSQLQWTQTNEAFHLVLPFNTQKYLFFTMSPSLFDFALIYQTVLKKSIKSICEAYDCIKQNMKGSFNYDKCCIWAIGQQIKSQKYNQIYINDGSGEPHHQFLAQQPI